MSSPARCSAPLWDFFRSGARWLAPEWILSILARCGARGFLLSACEAYEELALVWEKRRCSGQLLRCCHIPEVP